jgi:hypothetical protein
MIAEPKKPWIAYLMMWLGFFAMLGGLIIAVSQVFHWAKKGSSFSYPMTALFADLHIGHPKVSWVGIQNVIDWIMASPSLAVLWIGGAPLALLGGALVSGYEERKKQAA